MTKTNEPKTTNNIGNSQPRRDLIKEIALCIPENYWGCFSSQTKSEIVRMSNAIRTLKEPAHV